MDGAIDFITQEGRGTLLAKVDFCDAYRPIPVHFHNRPHNQSGPGEVRVTSIRFFLGFALGTLSNYIGLPEILTFDYPPQPPLPVATLTQPHACVPADRPLYRRNDGIVTRALSRFLVVHRRVPILHYLNDYLAAGLLNSRVPCRNTLSSNTSSVSSLEILLPWCKSTASTQFFPSYTSSPTLSFLSLPSSSPVLVHHTLMSPSRTEVSPHSANQCNLRTKASRAL